MSCHSCNSIPFAAKSFWNQPSLVTRHRFTTALENGDVQAVKQMHPCSPRTRKFKVVPSVGKMMAAVFWDHKHVLFIDFVEREAIFNAAVYSASLERLCAAIRRRAPGLLTKSWQHLHDKVRPRRPLRFLNSYNIFGGRIWTIRHLVQIWRRWFSPLSSSQRTSWWPQISEWRRCRNSSEIVALCPGHYILRNGQRKTYPAFSQISQSSWHWMWMTYVLSLVTWLRITTAPQNGDVQSVK